LNAGSWLRWYRVCLFFSLRLLPATVSSTRATLVLQRLGQPFALHPYAYRDHGGAHWAAQALGVDLHLVVKTLVFVDDTNKPLLVLMHGDAEVSTKKLAQATQRKRVSPAAVALAEKVTGYQVGGISPLGTRQPLPVVGQASLATLPTIYLNAGRRGLLLSIQPQQLEQALTLTWADCRQPTE
jgi:Cys-tRNA(Pro) deacylase